MMDMAHWPVQEMEFGASLVMGDMISPSSCSSKPMLERKARPQKDQALNCPRCNSINTKFCYYNNYSLTQPRYFCKTCKRYWTEGGSLRNVPVGGGSRKNKRSVSKKMTDLTAPNSLDSSNLPNTHDGKDLNLGFSNPEDVYKTHAAGLPFDLDSENSSSISSLSALNLMRNDSPVSNLSSLSPTNNHQYAAAELGLNDFRSLSSHGFSGFGNLQGISESGRLGFTLEDLTQASHFSLDDNRSQGEASGYWSSEALGGALWTHNPNHGPYSMLQ